MNLERNYWESGCLCVLIGRVEKKPENFDGKEACQYYYDNCICTRSDGHQVGYETDAEMRAEWLLMRGKV
jgi:hypothetical protein